MARHRTEDNSEELKTVLDRLAHVYSGCWTYEDKGVVKESMPGENGKERVTDASFTTVFDREAKRWRYEFKARNSQTKLGHDCIVWRNGASVKIWARRKGRTQTVEKIGVAISSAIGYSGESAFLIPKLLAPPEVRARGLLQLEDLCITEKLDFSGTGFLKISGYYPSRSRILFWVDVKTSLILKVDVETSMTHLFEPRSYGAMTGSGALATKTSITYSPNINIPLEDSKFEMKVPEE